MCLVWTVIRVLAENHDAHVIEWRQFQCCIDVALSGIDGGACSFFVDERSEIDEIWLGHFVAKCSHPRARHVSPQIGDTSARMAPNRRVATTIRR